MIEKIIFENFYSFKNQVEIDFQNNDPDDRYRDIFMIYGHNASGKTNFLRALSFIKWLLYNSWQRKNPEQDIPLEVFFNSDQPVKFELHFSSQDGQKYQYKVILNKKAIEEEALLKMSGKARTTFTYLFQRSLEKITNKKESQTPCTYNYTNLKLPIKKDDLLKNVRPNATVVSYLRQFSNPELNYLPEIFDSWASNVNFFGKGDISLSTATRFYKENPSYLEKIKNFLIKNDYGINEVEIKTKKEEEEETFFPNFVHFAGGKKFYLPFFVESTGTLDIFKYFVLILKALEKGGVLILDEFCAEIHPLTMRAILNYFSDPENNPARTQLIMTTHSTENMNFLARSNIIIIEKTNLISEAYKLSEVEGVRNEENFSKKYLSGAYGGIIK